MAVAPMAKVIIVSHRTQASELLEQIQRDGICQILNAEQAMVSKDFQDLSTAAEKPREIENLVARLAKCIAFLKDYTPKTRSILDAALAPRVVIDEQAYKKTVDDKQILDIIEQSEQTETAIEELNTEFENIGCVLAELEPWANLETPVEELGALESTKCMAGLMPTQHYQQTIEGLAELGAAVQLVRSDRNKNACLVVCFNESAGEVQKLLRAADFEQISFDSMTGTVAELIAKNNEKLYETQKQLHQQQDTARKLAASFLDMQILHDHYANLLNREQTKSTAPATEQTVIFEAWVRKADYTRLEKTVSKFPASNLNQIAPAEGEEIPVEITNPRAIRPFEAITRLYGMPQHFELDPTTLLMPFFALFFALCLTDAGYGLILIGLCAFFIKRMQGDKKLMVMLLICSVVTIGAGALTGGWFGDAAQQLSAALGWTWLAKARESMMWFDPMVEPMIFFKLSLGLGYLHIMVGLIAAFVHNLVQKKVVAAVCDQLTWLVMLNAIVLKLFGTGFGLSPQAAAVSGKIAMFPAVVIVLFSQRQGAWVGRLAMGGYNLFSTIFYMGDVLSYLRLMALGMVTGGLAMAFNVMAKTASEKGTIIGYITMIIILVVGHLFNTLISGLSAFVHTIRLQFVEFFPKFLEGGGKQFQPLEKEYKHIYINQ